MSKLNVIILAAGKGLRMHSDLPKVLHQLAGKSLIQHVVDTVIPLDPENIYVVYGQDRARIEAVLKDRPCKLIAQSEQLGTGHAVKQVIPHLNDTDNVLILYADTPLITRDTLKKLIHSQSADGLSLLTVNLDNPVGYGRIIRKNNHVTGIIEQKDASVDEQRITEINTGVMIVPAKPLKTWISQLTNQNAQKEYYLSDIIALAHQSGYPIETVQPETSVEAEGINTRKQQADLERAFQKKQAEQLLLAGLTLLDPERFDLRGQLAHGRDVVIDTNVIIEGNVKLGKRVRIGTGSLLRNCLIEDDVVILPYSIIEDSHLGQGSTVGPFAHLRPGSVLHANAHVGNFVELKNTQLGNASKAGHLTYLGDAEVGANVNIGAGTITCNYDGANKFKTIIADDVFVGSATQFVAPVTISKGATIGAGTTVTDNIQENELVIGRVKQQHKTGWKRPIKNNK